MNLLPASSSPDFFHRTPDEYQAFAYYHSQHLHSCEGSPDLAYYPDSPSASSDDYSCAGGPFTDGMICGHHVQDIYGGYVEYTPSESVDPVSPYAYMSGYDSHESLYASDSCHATFMHADSHGGNEAQATLPLSKVSTYSELMPHLLNEQYNRTLQIEPPIHTACPEAPSTCIAPSQCHGASEPTTHRHHPYPRTSRRRTREPRTSGDKAKTKHTQTPRHIRLPSAPYIPEPHYEHAPSPSASHSPDGPYGSPTVTPMDINGASPPPEAADDQPQMISFAVEEESKMTHKRKRRDAVNLACFFCRKRKIACKQPPEGVEDRTCSQCSTRDLECEYPKESRRGLRKTTTSLL